MSRLMAIAIVLAITTCKGVGQDKYIYSIRIGQGSHPDFIQTGFKMRTIDGLITALHGVASGDSFSAMNEQGRVLTSLTLNKVDIEHDLAVLNGPDLGGQAEEGLEAVDTVVPPSSSLTVVGHPLGIHLYTKHVSTGVPAVKSLDTMIPPASREAFVKRNSPIVGIDVINIEGDLTPGYSGAPVLQNGKLVGVEDGGLTMGAGIAWAIPIRSIHWRSVADVQDKLRGLSALQSSLLFALQTGATTSGDLVVKLAFVGVWEPVTFEGTQRGKLARPVVRGQIKVSLDDKEQLRATGTFTSTAKVKSEYNGMQPGVVYRETGKVSGIQEVFYAPNYSSYYEIRPSGRFTYGTWDGNDWINSRDEVTMESRVSPMGGFLRTRGLDVLFGKVEENSDTSSDTSVGVKVSRNNPPSIELYKVEGVEPSDTLSVRANPGVSSVLVARIPADSTGIQIIGAGVSVESDRWVPIQWHNTQGWVSKKFLMPANEPSPSDPDE